MEARMEGTEGMEGVKGTEESNKGDEGRAGTKQIRKDIEAGLGSMEGGKRGGRK
jgi:hypothetical protein